MATTIKERKLDPELKVFIMRSIQDLLEDPDFGFELTAKAKERLREAASRRHRWIPLSKIIKKYS